MANPTVRISITFQKEGKTLTRFEADLERKEDFQEAVEKAHQVFRLENPGTLLFDGVNVIYDTVS